MSATAEATTIETPEPATPFEKDNGTVLFLSRRAELRLIIEPRYPVIAQNSGRTIGEQPGQVVNFTDGKFICPREGKVVLEDGRDQDAGEVLEFLENHRLNGDVNGGFWRVDPVAPGISMVELEAMVKAAEEGDEETLQAILDRERAGWQRAELIRVAEGSLDRVRKINDLARREAELAAREAALAPAAPVEPAAAPERTAEQAAADEAKIAANEPEPAAPPILSSLAETLHEQEQAEPAPPTPPAE